MFLLIYYRTFGYVAKPIIIIMKKIIVLFCLFWAMVSWSQDFWTQFSTSQPSSPTGVKSISIVNTNTTWLNMSCGTTGCTTIRRFAKTNNGGSVWTSSEIDLGTESANLEIANISGVSDLVAYASVFPKQFNTFGGVWKTVDGGTTWSRQASANFSSPNFSFTNLVYFWNANDGVTLGDPADGYFEIYTTSNGGDIWTRVPSSSALIPIDPNEYGVTNNFTVTGNTIWAFTTFGRILKSTDKGNSWTTFQSPLSFEPCCFCDPNAHPHLAFSDENNGLLLTTAYELYNTTDGGNTWSYVQWSGALRDFNITAVPGLPNTYICIGQDLGSFQRGSSYSIDGGITWIDINSNPDLDYVNGGTIAMLNEDYGFASGFSISPTEGGIFRWGGGPMLHTAILAVPTVASGNSFQVLPNPTSGEVRISGKNISKVEVFDLLGKKIDFAVYDKLNVITYDLAYLKNGLYLVKVYNDEGTSLIKILKQ